MTSGAFFLASAMASEKTLVRPSSAGERAGLQGLEHPSDGLGVLGPPSFDGNDGIEADADGSPNGTHKVAGDDRNVALCDGHGLPRSATVRGQARSMHPSEQPGSSGSQVGSQT